MIFKKNFYSTIEIRNILGFNQFAMNTGKKQENSDMDESVPLYLNNVDVAFYLNKSTSFGQLKSSTSMTFTILCPFVHMFF